MAAPLRPADDDPPPPSTPATTEAAAPLEIRPYATDRRNPGDLSISVAAKPGTDILLAAEQGERRQSLRGFEPTYVDIVDFIIRVTHRIWEEKDIGHIYDTYRHNARVTDDYGLQYGRDKIVADTVHTINAFPDARLYADEVIWAGDDERGFDTSHRTVIIGHNTGYSKYGPPTGRKIVVWAIANCSVVRNEFFEEWVLYNNSSMLAQLGFDLRRLARDLGNAVDLAPLGDRRFGEAERLLGQGKPTPLPPAGEGGFDPEAFVRRAWHAIWNWRSLAAIDRAYAANVRWLGATDRRFSGRGELKSFVLSLLASFPDLAVSIDDVYWMGSDVDGYLVSVRWSAIGTHRGHGVYGAPTGRRVAIWGIAQHRIVDERITQEWFLFNEFELLQQILRDEPWRTAA